MQEANIEKVVKFDRFTALAIDGEVFIYDRVAKENFYKLKSKNAANIKGQGDKIIMQLGMIMNNTKSEDEDAWPANFKLFYSSIGVREIGKEVPIGVKATDDMLVFNEIDFYYNARAKGPLKY